MYVCVYVRVSESVYMRLSEFVGMYVCVSLTCMYITSNQLALLSHYGV